MLNEVAKQRIRQPILVGPLRVAENTVEGFRVGFFNSAHGLLQCLADVGGHFAHVGPMAIVRDLKPIILRKLGVFFVASSLGQRGLIFFVVNVRDAFEKQQRENVGLEIRGIHRAAQNVG